MATRIRTIVFAPGTEPGQTGVIRPSLLWQPRLDAYQTSEALLVQIEAPGLSLDDIELHFQPGQLIVQGVRKRPQLGADARAAMVEIAYGPFQRVVPLPSDADGEHIEANYEAGILSVRVPRIQRGPQKISIAG